jgi:hypothetical protein
MGDLIICVSACNASYCLDTICPKQRIMKADVPDFQAFATTRAAQKVAAARRNMPPGHG